MANIDRPQNEKIIADGKTTYIKYYPYIHKDGNITFNKFTFTKPNKQQEKKQKADDRQKKRDLITAIRTKLKTNNKGLKIADLEAINGILKF